MTEEANPTFILDDSPASDDALDFEPYVLTMADLITSEKARTPLTIGVFGPWGSGKTSLLNMIHKHVTDKVYRTVWFNAWKYARDDIALWRALVIRTLDALRPRDPQNPTMPFKGDPENLSKEDRDLLKELDRLEESIYRTVEWQELGKWNLDWPKALLGTAEGAAEVALTLVPGASGFVELFRKMREASGAEKPKVVEAFKREVSEYRREQLRSVEQFVHGFEQLVEEHVKGKGKLVLFIDDLDRCLPEQTIEVLEAIKLFLDVPECVFLLAVDQRTIQEGIKRRYKDLPESIDGLAYLEKIVQLPFQLPPIAPGDMENFVGSLVTEWPDIRCREVFVLGLGENPRQVKRTINVFLLLWQLAQRRIEKLGGQIKAVRLAKVVVIQNAYPELYEVLKRTPRLLRELEDYYQAEARATEREAQPAEGEPATEIEQVELPPVLTPYVNRAAVRRILTMHGPETTDTNFSGLPPDELRLYFTLTRQAEAPQVAPTELPREVFEPQPVRVPAGPFLMGSSDAQIEKAVQAGVDERWASLERTQHELELPGYQIGRYPVANAEYQVFVKETGHAPPRDWDGENYPGEKGDHPVVNVTWHDAMAYCKWLSEKTGKAYTLPSEAEWEKAARGEEGLLYPWGDEFDPERCNTKESGIGGTTPVGQYSPQGDSPYGCVDMAGNVWEWTRSILRDYSYVPGDGREDLEASGDRVLRGGSWSFDRGFARCAARLRINPGNWDLSVGFRVVVSPSAGL